MKVTSLRMNIINTTKLLFVDLESKIGNLSVNISGVLANEKGIELQLGGATSWRLLERGRNKIRLGFE